MTYLEEGLQWFCVRSQPKHEHIAAANLRRNLGLDVVSPRMRFRRPTVRGAVWVTESIFPNYLFARFDRAQMLRDVQHTFGVSGIIHFGVHWPTIPDVMIEELRAFAGEQVRVMEEELKPGDEIQMAGGAFHGLTAVVHRVMPAKARVALLLNFLGRETQVDVDLAAVVRTGPRFLAKVA
jgi:transcriptional antiterminator RfaH